MKDLIDLLACVDCGMYLAIGSEALEGADPSWSPDHIDQRWSGYDLMNGDSDKDHDFSWEPCELCGSKLGGARMHCVAWAEYAQRSKPLSYTCVLCGQRIDDGKPCGCGAR